MLSQVAEKAEFFGENEKPEAANFANLWRFFIFNLGKKRALRAFYFAGAQASGANVYMTGSSFYNRFHTLYVRLPCSVRASVGVRNLNTEGNTLSANFTFSHPTAPPYTSLHATLLSYCRLQTNISFLSDFKRKSKTFLCFFQMLCLNIKIIRKLGESMLWI